MKINVKQVFIEKELLLIIVNSPRFQREKVKFLNAISTHYKVNFSVLPLKSEFDLEPLDGKRLQEMQTSKTCFYDDALKSFLNVFYLDFENKTHCKAFITATFFNVVRFSSKPKVTLDFSRKTSQFYIEVFPWTTKKELDRLHILLQGVFNEDLESQLKLIFEFPTKIKSGSKKTKSRTLGTPVYKAKTKVTLQKQITIYFTFKEFEQEMLNKRKTESHMSHIQALYNNKYFQLKLKTALGRTDRDIDIDKVVSLASLYDIIQRFDTALSDYDLL